MIFSKSTITFIRGDDDAMMVALSDGRIFHLGDKVYFSLKTDKSDEEDILQVESTTFITYDNVENAAVMINISHADTTTLELGTYFYDILIEWADGTYVTVVPPTKFILAAGGSHD
jgi:hypothetical protein